MPRDLPLSNGNLLVAFDSGYRIREIFFPYVGQANHTLGKPFRFGVWVDGGLTWCDDPSWTRDLRYEPDTLVTQVTLQNDRLGLRLECHDCVDFDADVFVRRIDLRNLRNGPREVRLFFHQDFDIGGSAEGDTAYYDPELKALAHFKGRYWFLIGAQVGRTPGLAGFATGITGVRGTEGTWRDAEDGELSRNPIVQGSVDSTGALHVDLDETASAYFWICAGQDADRVRTLHGVVSDPGPERILSRTRAYWRQWASHDRAQAGIPDDVREFYRRSLLILRTQIDNRGAILAANDSDTLEFNRDSYSYMWPRDGALVAQSLDLAGRPDLSQRFFTFCETLQRPDGYFMHKYNPDGSLGSSWHPWCDSKGNPQLPIQEDETALVLYALWEHYERSRDLDFVRPLYRGMIKRAGDFLCRFRDEKTGLPLPSWDLWEERRGIHLFTVAAVYAGLAAASSFAEIFGDSDRAERYARAAAEVRAAAETHLYDSEKGVFLRSIFQTSEGWEPDRSLDSSQAAVFQFNMLRADDERVERTMRAIADKLWCRTEVGGLARYEADPYQAVQPASEDVQGNPWIICTLWLAQWQIARAESLTDLDAPMDILRWTMARALPSGVLAEQLNPQTRSPVSVSPLTWSHATFITTVCRWEERWRRITDPHPLSVSADL